MALRPAYGGTTEASIGTLLNLTSVQGQTLLMSGALTVEAASLINQDLTSDSDPTFRDLSLTGDLTVNGTTTTINSMTLVVDDKNIELGSVAAPTDLTADGGGITLKGEIDKTIAWLNATNSWTFNQSIDLLGNNLISTGIVNVGQVLVNNLKLDGNALSSTAGDLDVTTQTGGVFKFVDNAFQSGQDASNYLEIGHGGSNSFVNQVGAGGMDFRFGGTTKATFTAAGHLHLLTDTDQKHNLKIKTASNLADSGIAWENSGGNFSQTIFRTDVGSNRSDLVFAIGSDANIDLLTSSFKIHGAAASEGRLEILSAFQVSSGSPALGKVLTSTGTEGVTTWSLPSGGGFTDVGSTIILTNINDDVGIGTSGPATKLHTAAGGTSGVAPPANTIATFEKNTDGFLSILTPDANERGVIFGSPQAAVDGGVIFNSATTLRGLQFRVSGNVSKMALTSVGDLGIGTDAPNAQLDVRGPGGVSVGGAPSGALHVTSTLASVNSNAVITGHNLFGGNKQLWYLGSTSSSNDNVAFICRQNAELHLHTNDTVFFALKANGDIRFHAYPNTRDDGTPINILGTDASGNLISGPNEVIHIGGNFVDTTDQVISVADTAQDVTFNTNSTIDDISHTAGSATFTVNTDGVYDFIVAPQLAQGSGSATVEFWIEKNGTTIANSGVQETIPANSQRLPLLSWKENFVATDTFKIIWASNSVNTSLDNIASGYSGANIPSIMLRVTHSGSS